MQTPVSCGSIRMHAHGECVNTERGWAFDTFQTIDEGHSARSASRRANTDIGLTPCSPHFLAYRSDKSLQAHLSCLEKLMPQYLIERNIPGAGNLSPADLKAISQKSCSVLNEMGPQIQWLHSYVTADGIYCIYRAPNEEMIREHARQGGFPADRVLEVKTVIDPTTAE